LIHSAAWPTYSAGAALSVLSFPHIGRIRSPRISESQLAPHRDGLTGEEHLMRAGRGVFPIRRLTGDVMNTLSLKPGLPARTFSFARKRPQREDNRGAAHFLKRPSAAGRSVLSPRETPQRGAGTGAVSGERRWYWTAPVQMLGDHIPFAFAVQF
jgi:hypothetical protein